MTDKDPKRNKTTETGFSQVLRLADGRPFVCEEWLHKIAEGMKNGHTSQHAATLQLVEIAGMIRGLRDNTQLDSHEENLEGLQNFYDRTLCEIFEFAEHHRLPLAAAMRKSLNRDQSTGPSR